MDEDLAIPEFLRRINKDMGKIMNEPNPETKTRKTTQLPSSITIVDDDGNQENHIIENLSLADLAAHQERLKRLLADVPSIQLELKAINAQIRKKAK